MPNSMYDPSDPRYWEEPESNENLDPAYYWADDPYDDDDEDLDLDDLLDNYDPDTGRAFINGQWVIVNQQQNDQFWRR